MTLAEYEALGRIEKLAVFLVVIGQDAAAFVLKGFEEAQVRSVCKAMAAIRVVSPEVQQKTLDDFTELIKTGMQTTRGGQQFVRGALAQAVGAAKAERLLEGLLPQGPGAPGPSLQALLDMQDRELFNILQDESPQTIAFVLAQLQADRMYRVLGFFEAELRGQIIECIAALEPTNPELLARTVGELKHKLTAPTEQRFQHSDGVQAVASLLNLMSKDESKALLARLEKTHEALAKIIRKKMFEFEDICKLEAAHVQKLIQEVETNDLAFALKIASEGLKTKIFGAMSKRAAEGLRYEIKMLGGVKKADVLAAQDKLVDAVRRLEESGAISLEGGGETIE